MKSGKFGALLISLSGIRNPEAQVAQDTTAPLSTLASLKTITNVPHSEQNNFRSSVMRALLCREYLQALFASYGLGSNCPERAGQINGLRPFKT